MTRFLHSSRVHLVLVWVWLALLLPTLLYWRESIVWIVLMSWWANFASHWAAYQAARAEEHSG
jgi:hypothetical protein